MPTFKEKCPEFGQKIMIEGNLNGVFIWEEKRGGMPFYVALPESLEHFSPSTKWTPLSEKLCEEPQWIHITADESTWPPLNKYVAIDGSLIGIRYKDTDVKRDLIGQFWTHIPKRKKEEKTHLGDGSIEQLKREETEARLLKLERKADEFDDFIRSHKRKESSPWKCAINNPPPFGKLVFVRMKQNNGEFGYCISGRYDILRWHHDPLNRQNGFKDEEDFVGEWMEIPK